MDGNSDWRLTNQDRYLKNAVLVRRKYHPTSTKWEHDHCEFCWAKFMEVKHPEILNEGYCTEDSRHWICDGCFNDFKEKFGFAVKD
jgi:hypothetical protein